MLDVKVLVVITKVFHLHEEVDFKVVILLVTKISWEVKENLGTLTHHYQLETTEGD